MMHHNSVARTESQPALRLLMTALFLVCALLCSCSRAPSSQKESSDVRTLISTDETRQIGMHVLLNRYPDAKIVSEQGEGQLWKYRFATNGTTIPSVLVVDRKAAKARFENLSR
jgi:hypothetical protein